MEEIFEHFGTREESRHAARRLEKFFNLGYQGEYMHVLRPNAEINCNPSR